MGLVGKRTRKRQVPEVARFAVNNREIQVDDRGYPFAILDAHLVVRPVPPCKYFCCYTFDAGSFAFRKGAVAQVR